MCQKRVAVHGVRFSQAQVLRRLGIIDLAEFLLIGDFHLSVLNIQLHYSASHVILIRTQESAADANVRLR